MSWHGQINRTLWEVQQQVAAHPDRPRFRRELVRAHFLQRFEYDKAHHIPRDDRTFLFLHEEETPACLLLHGATGTPAEMRELGNYLYQNGISVYCPRLSRVDAKERLVSWESWATQAETALDTLMTYSNQTFVVGLSLGGTLAMVLSGTKGLAGIALLAPAIYPKPTLKNRLLAIVHLLTPPLFYRFAGWNGEMVKAMDAARSNAKHISIPVLALHAQDDPYLSTRGIKFIRRHARLESNDIRTLEHGGHVISQGPARDEVVDAVAEFVHRVAKTPAGERVRASGRPEGSPDAAREEGRGGRPGDGRSRRGGRGRGRGRRGGGGGDGGGDRAGDRAGGERRARRSDGERPRGDDRSRGNDRPRGDDRSQGNDRSRGNDAQRSESREGGDRDRRGRGRRGGRGRGRGGARSENRGGPRGGSSGDSGK